VGRRERERERETEKERNTDIKLAPMEVAKFEELGD